MGSDYNKLLQHFETKFHDIASSIKRAGMRWEEVRYINNDHKITFLQVWSRLGIDLDWPIVVAWVTKPSATWMNPLVTKYNVSFLSYNGWYLNHNAGKSYEIKALYSPYFMIYIDLAFYRRCWLSDLERMLRQ